MRVLHIVSGAPGDAVEEIVELQRSAHEVTVLDLQTERDWAKVVDLIVAHDQVVSWVGGGR